MSGHERQAPERWHAEPEDFEDLILDAAGETVAWVGDKGHWPRAQLIAAAPAMRDKLRDVAMTLRRVDRYCWAKTLAEQVEEVLREAGEEI